MPAPNPEPDVWTLGDIDVGVALAGADAGERVVMIHGLAQDGSMWEPLQRGLVSVHSLAYDLRGHGRSTLGKADGTLAQLGGDLIRLLEKWGSATCIGFSLGGTVALWTAARRPDLISRLAVLGTSSVVGSAAADFYAGRVELVCRGDRDEIFQSLLGETEVVLAGNVDADEIATERMRAIGDGRGYANAATAMIGLRDSPLTPELRRIDQETLVVGGELDTLCPRKAADIMLADLPNASYREVAGAGHLMTVDRPDAVLAELRSFLG